MSNKSVLILQLFQDKLVLSEYKGDKNPLESFKFELEITHDILYREQTELARRISDRLKSDSIKTSSVIVIPHTAEILVRNISIPPLSDMSMLKGVVSSRLDRELKLSSSEMILDYCGEISSQSQNNILVAGLQKKRETALQNLCESAGLNPVAIVPEFVWLYRNHIKTGANENIIYITDDTAAIAKINNGHISNVSSFNVNNISNEALIGKIVAELLRNPVYSESEQRKFKVICGKSGIAEQLDKKTDGNFSFFQATEPHSECTAELAGINLTGKDYVINFEHNHFTGKRKNPLSGNTRKAIIAAFGLLAFVAWFFIDWQNDKNQIDEDNAFIQGIELQVKASKDIIDKIGRARMWSNTESHYSKYLADVSNAFPDADSIWTNSLSLDENYIGIITGSSLSNTNIENMLKGFSLNPHFSDIQTQYIRQAGPNTSELSFAMKFKYNITPTENTEDTQINDTN